MRRKWCVGPCYWRPPCRSTLGIQHTLETLQAQLGSRVPPGLNPHGIYTVCQESNETGAVFFFYLTFTYKSNYPLQSSSLRREPHTAGDVASTPSSNAGSLYVEVPSAGLSWSFGCCPQFRDDDLWGGIMELCKVASCWIYIGTYKINGFSCVKIFLQLWLAECCNHNTQCCHLGHDTIVMYWSVLPPKQAHF
jgi:hypothetical protein